jgi:hypothetical protein
MTQNIGLGGGGHFGKNVREIYHVLFVIYRHSRPLHHHTTTTTTTTIIAMIYYITCCGRILLCCKPIFDKLFSVNETDRYC